MGEYKFQNCESSVRYDEKEVNCNKNMIIAVLGSKEMLEMEMKQLNNKHKTLYMKGQLYVVILIKKEKS